MMSIKMEMKLMRSVEPVNVMSKMLNFKRKRFRIFQGTKPKIIEDIDRIDCVQTLLREKYSLFLIQLSHPVEQISNFSKTCM